MDPNEIIRPQTETTVWIYGSGHKNEGQVAQPNEKGAFPVIRTTVYRRDGRIQVWQRSPDQGPEFGVLMPDLSSVDDKIAAEFQRAQDKADAAPAKPTNVYVGTNPTTGKPTQISEWPDGHKTYDDTQVPATANVMPQGSYPRTEGTRRPDGTYDNSQPVQVWHAPDGSVVKIEPLTADEHSRWEREKNQGAGVGALTDAQIAEQARQPAKPAAPKGELREIGGHLREFDPSTGDFTIDHGPTTSSANGTAMAEQPVKDRPGWREVTTKTTKDGNSVQGTYYLGPNGEHVDTLPGQETTAEDSQPLEGSPGWRVVKRARKDAAGNTVSATVYLDPQGKEQAAPPPDNKFVRVEFDKDQGKWFGLTKDNKWVPMEGGPGATVETGNQGPSLPHVVLGQMKDGLTAFREDLTHQVGAGTLTPAVAERRWKEATDIAEFGIRESSLLQQDEISRRSSDVSLRTNAMSNGTAVFNNALDFIAKINPTLKVGSTAGARAFREILQMHQDQMQSIGAYRNEFSDPSAARGAPPRGAAAAASVPGVSSPDAHPPVDVSPGAPASAPAASGSLFPGPSGSPAVDTGNVGISPDGSAAVTPDGSTAPVDVNRPLPTAAAPTLTAPITVKHKVTGLESQVPASSWQDMTNRDDFEVVSGTPPPVGMAPPDGPDIGVLSAYQPMQAPIAPPVAPAQDAGPLPGVLRAQQIANTPPWRLSNEDLAWAHQNGLLDHAMAVPGVGA